MRATLESIGMIGDGNVRMRTHANVSRHHMYMSHHRMRMHACVSLRRFRALAMLLISRDHLLVVDQLQVGFQVCRITICV